MLSTYYHETEIPRIPHLTSGVLEMKADVAGWWSYSAYYYFY